ncbi:hypothetical protein NE237_010037 [Protea cynaroides]|uniref:Uncharacterized protein n=1 Tax=Protea cynaroides TaxID=273540 RepID=A0A9Q0R178_9MAGN|nr:hypothetical protein NE237_010037 [Protea cynaroides]
MLFIGLLPTELGKSKPTKETTMLKLSLFVELTRSELAELLRVLVIFFREFYNCLCHERGHDDAGNTGWGYCEFWTRGGWKEYIPEELYRQAFQEPLAMWDHLVTLGTDKFRSA